MKNLTLKEAIFSYTEDCGDLYNLSIKREDTIECNGLVWKVRKLVPMPRYIDGGQKPFYVEVIAYPV